MIELKKINRSIQKMPVNQIAQDDLNDEDNKNFND